MGITRRAFLSGLPMLRPACAAPSRIYHRVTIGGMAHTRHTHVEVSGVVQRVTCEEDGDHHVVLVDAEGRFVVGEIIPRIPIPVPGEGHHITVRGISRRDGVHGWPEIHPIEEIL